MATDLEHVKTLLHAWNVGKLAVMAMIDAAGCSNQQHCAKCKGKHAASSRQCPMEKQVQQIKVERCISFQDARKAALSKRTSASVVSGSTTVSAQLSQKQIVLVAAHTELTWLQETDIPVPVKSTVKQRKSIAIRIVQKHRNTTSTKK